MTEPIAKPDISSAWTVVQAGPDSYVAERIVQSLGPQKVSVSAADAAGLQTACDDYDAYYASLPGGGPP